MQPFHGGLVRKLFRPLNGVTLLTAGLLLSGPAGAMNTAGQCVGNLSSPLSPGNSCTANDVTLVLVAAGAQNDGCISPSDTVNLLLGARLENTTGQTRYDIGIFIYNYLGNDPSPDAFGGQQCAVETLRQPYATVGTNTCPPLNLSGGSGPFFNADGNGCADLVKGQCNSAPVLMNFTTPVSIKCSDNINGSGASLPDGFADISSCTTWGNSTGQVGPSGVCSSELDVMPGTGSKCRCQTINSTVPVPRLANACSCSPTPVRPGASTSCTVSFTNTVPNCTAVAASASSPEREQCGTASFVRYKVGYNAAQGQMLSSSPATPVETTGGTVTVDAASQQVVWTPRNTTASGTSLGVIGPGESGSMTYQFYVAPSVPGGTTINQTVTMYWSSVGPSSWTGEVGQAQTVSCSFGVSNQATFARVSSFGAREEGGEVALVWETAAEVGTVAFEVERLDRETGRFVPVTERPVPAVAQLPGGRYRLVDPAAPRGQELTYRITEVDQQGAREVFGPFEVEVAAETGAAGPGEIRGLFQADGKAVSPRVVRSAQSPRQVTAAAAVNPGTARRAKIEVAQSGLQRVRTADLAGVLGLSQEETAAQLRAGRFRLSRGGQDVAWQPAADGDGLVFHGEALHNAYTDVNVYWLEIGRGQIVAPLAARPAAGSGAASFVDTIHFDTDVIPAIASPVPVDDHWIWKSFYPGFPGFDRGTFPVEVPTPAAGGATLAVHLVGFTEVQRAEIWLNGRRLDDLEWGNGLATVTVAVPAGLLVDGANRIEIVALEAARGFWLDAFDLTYPRLYRAQADRLAFRAAAGSTVALSGFRGADVAVWDLSQPLAPRRLTGLAAQPQADGTWSLGFTAPSAGPFAAATAGALVRPQMRRSAPADLMSRGAEYLVIAPAELRAGAQRLADLRAAQGLSTRVVDLADILDLFGDGISDPRAIQRFLTHAVSSWPTPPRYVVLAGKGSYDYRNLLRLSSSRVPPLLVATEGGLAPADAAFADPDGRGVPAVAIGRIPALTAAELDAYVDKLAAYESAPGGPWKRRALLVADDPDLGGDFPAARDALAGALPPGFGVTRIDADPAQMASRRSQLQAALREGHGLMSYVGHGGLDRLASDGLLLTSDVAGLGNAPHLPVVTALTCLISQFAYPTLTSLGEELVLRADGGAIALYGPTWMSYNTPASTLGGYLLPQLAAPDGGRLGDRLLRGLDAYTAAGGDRSMLRLYTLLGDPALVIERE